MALTGFAPIQLGLDRLEIKIQPRRTAINDHANPAAMGFPEGADAEQAAETAAHGVLLLPRAYGAGSPLIPCQIVMALNGFARHMLARLGQDPDLEVACGANHSAPIPVHLRA